MQELKKIFEYSSNNVIICNHDFDILWKNKKAEETKTGLVSSETEIEMVEISELGRCLGSTEIKIEAELTNYYYTDDIICNLTLVTKTI